MHRFYQPELQQGFLNEEESQHASRVLRVNVGDEIEVFDGNGNFLMTYILEVSKKRVDFHVNEIKKSWDAGLILPSIAIAPTKNISRFEWFLEKSTEIGIGNIYPIFTARSERKSIKTERLHKIILAATKQSKRTVLPILHEPIKFKEFVERLPDDAKFIAHCIEDEKETLLINQKSSPQIPTKISPLITIGPEGDFTEEEINLAFENSFKPISFGEARFRTETAGIFACIKFQNQ